MKEKYVKMNDDFGESEKVDQMLINALEAKLSILDRV